MLDSLYSLCFHFQRSFSFCLKMDTHWIINILIVLLCIHDVLSQQYRGHLRELPHFNQQPFNVSAFRGESAVLPCSVTHLAANQAVAWMKLNPTSAFLSSGMQSFSSEVGKLEIVGEHRQGNLQYDLRINNVTDSDGGEYICTVVEFGDLNRRRWRRSRTATIAVVTRYPKPTLKCVADPAANNLFVGIQVRLGCRLDGAGQMDRRISMNWTRHAGAVVSQTRFQGIQFGGGKHLPELLHTFRISSRDHGSVFECSAEYDHFNGTNWVTIRDGCSLHPLDVKPYSSFALSRRSRVVVNEGQQVRFVCPAHFPASLTSLDQAFTWNIVPTISPHRFRLSHNGDELIIHRVAVKDEGLKVSCFIPPLTSATHKKEMQISVRKVDPGVFWEPRHPTEDVPFGPEALTDPTPFATEARLPESTTDADVTTVAIDHGLTETSDMHNAKPDHGTTTVGSILPSDADKESKNKTKNRLNDTADKTVMNKTIAFELTTKKSETNAVDNLAKLFPSLSTSSSHSNSDESNHHGPSRNPNDGGEDPMDGGDPFLVTPDIDYAYVTDDIGQNINRTELEPSNLSSSDFIFIFVMIAEVILTVLLVVLLLITGPVCFGTKRNKDNNNTVHTDVEKSISPPFPLMISSPRSDKNLHTYRSEHKSRRIAEKTISTSSDRSLKKEIPTVDITLCFEMKDPDNDTSDLSTSPPMSAKDDNESNASTVEFKTFGYPRSGHSLEDSSEA